MSECECVASQLPGRENGPADSYRHLVWSTSVGTDVQAYFRVFNPTIQSKKFDPQGIYIKKYLSELKNVPIKFIHDPRKYDPKLSYPDQIIDHAVAQKLAISTFSKVKKY